MADTWLRESCPHCSAINWFDQGDTNDPTSFMGEEAVAQCHACNKRWWLADDAYEQQQAIESGRWLEKYSDPDVWVARGHAGVQIGLPQPR